MSGVALAPVPDAVRVGRVARAHAWLVTRLRFLVVAAWIAGGAAATLYLPGLGAMDSAPLGGLVPSGGSAVRTETRAAELFSVPLLSDVAVVERDPRGLSPQAQRAVLERAARVDRHTDPSLAGIAFALPVVNSRKLLPSSREDATTAVTYLFFPPGTSLYERSDLAHEYARASVATVPGAPVAGVTGAVPARLVESRQIGDALPLVELGTVCLIALILGLTFRAVGAPAVALFSAAVAYAVGVRVIAWLGTELGLAVPRELEPLVVVLLLGIVTDYAVFFLSGQRRRLVAGEHRVTAAARTAAQYAPVILTAGLIVAAGGASLVAGRLEFFRAIGPGMALTALVGLAVSVTLIPALLAIFGRAVFWPSLRRADIVPAGEEPPAGGPPAPAERPPSRARARLARLATARPLAALTVVASVAVLLAAASGLRETKLGFPIIRGLPSGTEVRNAALAAGQGFSPGILGPTEIVVEQSGVAAERGSLVRLQQALARQPGVAGVVGPGNAPSNVARGVVVARNGDAARYAVVLANEPLGGDAVGTLRELQERMPSLLAQSGLAGARVGYAGDTALVEETVDSTLGDLERIALALLGVNLLFLVVFLRSLIAPLFLLAASVLALAAALGATVYVFQGLLGHAELSYYVPFAAAVLLVSLGSDYNVFVVGQVWDEATRRPLREAIAVAAPRASRAITVAGAALALSFALLAVVPLRPFRELAFTLCVGVLADAFIVRSLLVPALISLFGDVSWWPGRRRRLRRAVGAPARGE